MVRLQRLRNGNREQIGAAAEGLIGVYDGRQLLPLGVDQEPSRFQEFTLGGEHVQVVDLNTGAWILKQAGGGLHCGLKRLHCLFLDLDTAR